jgi:WD40 repeat protein
MTRRTEKRLFDLFLNSCWRQDELNPRAEFGVKRCNIAKFSNGGAVFAAVGRTNVIVVHHAYAMNQLGQLKGHISAVTSLEFSRDDRMLVSTGAGGAVYFWDLTNFSRIVDMEHVDKKLIFNSSAFLSR